MVTLNGVYQLVAMGNTYANTAELKALGFAWNNGQREWRVDIDHHPMNNSKQRKKLLERLTKLEEQGVRFAVYTTKGIAS